MNGVIARQIVQHGMTLLDRVRPGWDAEIDLTRLDISCPNDCLLGQLYGSFAQGMRRLSVPASVYGFHAPPYSNRAESLALLTEAWREAIGNRRLERMPQRVLAAI